MTIEIVRPHEKLCEIPMDEAEHLIIWRKILLEKIGQIGTHAFREELRENDEALRQEGLDEETINRLVNAPSLSDAYLMTSSQ